MKVANWNPYAGESNAGSMLNSNTFAYATANHGEDTSDTAQRQELTSNFYPSRSLKNGERLGKKEKGHKV